MGSFKWLAALAAGLALLGASASAHAAWLKAEGAHFIVYGDAAERDLRTYAERLETFDSVLRLLHGLDPKAPVDRKLPIYFVNSHEEMRQVSPGATPYLGGFHHASARDIFAVARLPNDFTARVLKENPSIAAQVDRPEITIFHEYTHHFMLRHFPYGYPRWLVEGYADYFMTAAIEDDEVVLGLPTPSRVQWLQEGGWIPLADLLRSKLDRAKVGQVYAQSWLLTHYFLSDALADEPVRYRQLGRYTAAIARGSDPVTAMEAATGMPVAELERRLRAYFRGALPGVRIPRSAIPAAEIRVSPAEAPGDLMLDHQALVAERFDERWKPNIERIRRRAAALAGHPLAEATLALAELRLGDKQAGRGVLTRRLAAAPSDQEALEIAAADLMDQGDAAGDAAQARRLYAEAHGLLARSFKAGLRYQTLLGLARARRVLDKPYPSDNTLEILLLATELAPQVSDVRLETARALMHRGRYAEAAARLQPVLNAAHGGKAEEQARALLKEIEARRAGGAS